MELIGAIAGVAAGLVLGGGLAWVLLRTQIARLREQVDAASAENKQLLGLIQTETAQRAAAEEKAGRVAVLESEVAARETRLEERQREITRLSAQVSELETRLEGERAAAAEKLALLDDAQRKLADAFKSLSAEALKSNNESFLSLARENLERFQQAAQGDLGKRQEAIGALVKPLAESLEKVNQRIEQANTERTKVYTSLTEQVKGLTAMQQALQGETQNLVKALRQPAARGRWGEIQLQRVVEMAGMVEYCDFAQQESVQAEGGLLRPDMVIRLPSRKSIVVDSKVPLAGYLDALEAPNEEARQRQLKRHARHVRDHIVKLSAKAYWNQFDATPEFVVLFLPGETFFSAALEQDPGLIEEGANQQVIMATPTTLIALLKAVAYGWRQEQLAENAQKISSLGRELYERVRVLAGHFDGMRKGLEGATTAYNKAVGSFESRVLVSTRKFQELGAASNKDIPEVQQIEAAPRSVQTDDDLTGTPILQQDGAEPGDHEGGTGEGGAAGLRG